MTIAQDFLFFIGGVSSLEETVEDSLSITEQASFVNIYNKTVTDTLIVTDNQIFVSIYSISVSDILTISETIISVIGDQELVTDNATFTETISYSSVFKLQLSDTFSISESLSQISTRSLSISDTLNITEIIRSTSDIDISFSTQGISLTMPEVDTENLIIFPYNFIDPPLPYGVTNYAFMTSADFNFSATCLFRLTMDLTLEERQSLYNYFSYWRTNPFDIVIQDDLWRGYLTNNNLGLMIRQFSEGANLTLEFEAIKAR